MWNGMSWQIKRVYTHGTRMEKGGVNQRASERNRAEESESESEKGGVGLCCGQET